MQNKLIFVLLLLIILLGSFLRLANLDKNPNGFYVDEAVIGYNAYSFLETGKDEYGKELPIFLRSFGAYSSPLYTYAIVPFIKIFGVEVFAVRFLSVISGIISIALIFFVVSELFKDKKLALISALVFAVSPWSIFFSRGAFEANFSLMLFLLSILTFFHSLNRAILFIPAVLILGISTYAYQAQRLIAFVFLFGFLFLYYKQYLKQKNSKIVIGIGIFLFLLIQLPQILLLQTPAFTVRQSGLFYGDDINRQVQELSKIIPEFISWPVIFIKEFGARFLSYLSPRNLFFESDPDLQRSFPQLSVFYSWMIIPFFIGIFEMLKRKKQIKITILLIISSLIAPSLTIDPFSTLRALPLIVPLVIIIGLGLFKILSFRKLKTNVLVLLFFSIISVISLYRSLAVLLPNERALDWSYGFNQLAGEITKQPTTEFLLDSSRIKPAYIELAFFLKVHPYDFQNSIDQTIKDDYYTNTNWTNYYKFANVEIRNIDWKKDIYQVKILVGDEFAISPEQVKEHFLSPLFEIKGPGDEIIFRGYKTNPDLKCLVDFSNLECVNEKQNQ